MRALIAVMVLLSGCASNGWAPATLDANHIEIRFLSESEWVAFQRDRAGCDSGNEWGCLPPESAGVANWSGNTCIIWFPARRGMPSYGTITHEIRHCYQGHHIDWD